MKKLFHVLAQTPPWKGEELLVFIIGKEHCSFAATDVAGKNLYELAYYTSEEINENFLNQLMVLHPELHQSFSKTLVTYDYVQNILIPAQSFRQENAVSLIRALTGIGKDMLTFSDVISGKEFYSIYAAPKQVHDWMVSKFPSAVFCHCSKFGVKNLPQEDQAGFVRIDFSTNIFNVIVSRGRELLLCQNYSYETPNDVIYYLLKICQRFSLSPSEAKLILSGLIDKQSNLFHELYQYFINIDFKNADWNINGDNEYPLHFFASLNETLQCEL